MNPKASRPGVPHTAPKGATVHDAFPPFPTKKKQKNNTYAYSPLNATNPANIGNPSPFAPPTPEYLSCLNKTIGGALLIMDSEKVLTDEEMHAIIFYSVSGSP